MELILGGVVDRSGGGNRPIMVAIVAPDLGHGIREKHVFPNHVLIISHFGEKSKNYLPSGSRAVEKWRMEFRCFGLREKGGMVRLLIFLEMEDKIKYDMARNVF